MEINKHIDDEKTVFSLHGRLDAASSPKFQESLEFAFESSKKIILNFKHLAYISSAGLRILMIAIKTSMATGVEFMVTNVPPEIMKLLEMTKLSSYIKIIQEETDV